MLRRSMALALIVPLLVFGCGSADTDEMRGTCTLTGSISQVSDLYNVVVTLRGMDNDVMERIRLIGDGDELEYAFEQVPLGRYDVFAEVTAKPDMPPPPEDRKLLDPAMQAVVFETKHQEAVADFVWRGEEDTAPAQLPRGYTFGDAINVPDGYDVILTLRSATLMKRLRLDGWRDTREWKIEGLPPDSYTIEYDLYHRPGEEFATPGRWAPESATSMVLPGLPTPEIEMRWEPFDPGENPGKIKGVVSDIPSGHDAIVVAQREGRQWKAYASGLIFNTYTIDKLPPGAYVVTVKLWNRDEQRYVAGGGQFKPDAMVEVTVPEDETVDDVDFTWAPDILR